MTINSTIEALSEAKLDLAAGGMRELIDTELDAVCGGLFDFGNIVIAPNIATQVACGCRRHQWHQLTLVTPASHTV